MDKTQKILLLREWELIEQIHLHKTAGGEDLLRAEKQHPGNFYKTNLVLLPV